MGADAIPSSWHEHFPSPRHDHRRVGPADPCPPPRPRECDCYEPLPFHKFLERQNQEFRAAVERHEARRPNGAPVPSQEPPRAATGWPRIGDVVRTPDPAPARRREPAQVPKVAPGRFVDLWV